MKKIIFDWLVIDPYNWNYSCSRWCLPCDKSKRKEKLNKPLDLKFLVNIYKYFNTNNIAYNSISFNVFGNIFYNVALFIKSIYIYEKIWLLKPWHIILLYWNIYSQIDYNKLKIFFNLFRWRYNFILWVNFDLSNSYQKNIFLIKKIESLLYSLNIDNVEFRLIINRDNSNLYSEFERLNLLDKLEKISWKIWIFFSEEEPSWKKSNISYETLFLKTSYNKCVYIEFNNPKLEEDYLYLPMINIAKEKISIHWPNCMKIKNINFWKVWVDFDLLKINWTNILNKITFLEKEYKASNKNLICDFCLNNF